MTNWLVKNGTIKANNRTKYSRVKDKFRSEDILVISDFDRLGKDADNVIRELKELFWTGKV